MCHVLPENCQQFQETSSNNELFKILSTAGSQKITKLQRIDANILQNRFAFRSEYFRKIGLQKKVQKQK